MSQLSLASPGPGFVERNLSASVYMFRSGIRHMYRATLLLLLLLPCLNHKHYPQNDLTMSLAGKAIEIVSFPASKAFQKDVHLMDGVFKVLRTKTPYPYANATTPFLVLANSG